MKKEKWVAREIAGGVSRSRGLRLWAAPRVWFGLEKRGRAGSILRAGGLPDVAKPWVTMPNAGDCGGGSDCRLRLSLGGRGGSPLRLSVLAPHAFFQPRAPPGLLSSRVPGGLNVYHTHRRVVLPNALRTDAARDPHCSLHLSAAGQPRAFWRRRLPLEEADKPHSAERAGGAAGMQEEEGAAGGEGAARTGALPRASVVGFAQDSAPWRLEQRLGPCRDSTRFLISTQTNSWITF